MEWPDFTFSVLQNMNAMLSIWEMENYFLLDQSSTVYADSILSRVLEELFSY